MVASSFSFPKYDYKVQINKFASQASGSAWFCHGGTVVLATVVSTPSKEFPGFLPLSVDYREQFSAAGKIPGGYMKREGKSTDREVLISRIIDRSIRPLFPQKYFDQVQIIITVYSVDKNNPPHIPAVLAASMALSVSNIPFMGPVGIAEVSRLDGKWVVNSTYENGLESDVKITVVGTQEGICMVEGSTNEISELELVDALFLAHETIKEQVAWQIENINIPSEKKNSEISVDWQLWQDRSNLFLTNDLLNEVFVSNKKSRKDAIDKIQKSFIETVSKEFTTEEFTKITKIVSYIFDECFKEKTSALMCEKQERVDGRQFDKVRDISCEVGILPFTHGSSVFQRGGTQGLVTLTLGSGQDEQRIEDIMGGDVDGSFMLHYNFPPFSVGEVKPLRPPSRREIGHGHLAASAFKYVLPSKESFPYTIRIVADILESDGSSSMATVCGSTMAFLNGGVQIKDMVGGVAMGLLKGDNTDFMVLTDISGFEDAFGLMDFKVAGTENGITAIQMDIKYKGGLSRPVFEKALEKAKIARIHIIGEMKKTMSVPSEKLSDLVPQVMSFKVDTDKIGAIIGSGGKVIRDIIDKTGTSIDIEDDGTVKIFGQAGPTLNRAIIWVKTLAGQIEAGSVYSGTVRRVTEFGLFVELVPGKDGLVHISAIDRSKQKTLAQDFPIGMSLKVQVAEYDKEQDRIRLKLC